MTPEKQLGWEARTGRLAAAAAIGAAALSIVALVVERLIIARVPEGDRGALTDFAEHQAQYVGARILQAIVLLLSVAVLLFLLRATIARRPEVPKLVVPLVILGPVLTIAGAVIVLIESAGIADEFVSAGAQTEERAEDVGRGASRLGLVVGQAGFFCVAVSFVLVSLNAMRAGLLSRFMGILGVVIGALVVLGLSPVQAIVGAFWFGALAALFLDRWPNGRGPAWSAVEPIPWPSARDGAGGEQAGAIPADDPTIEPAADRDEQAGDPEGDPDEPVGDPSDPRGEAHPVSKKRKRKRKR